VYTVDEHDEVRPLPDVPQCDVGAPCPVVFGDEGLAIVAYFARRPRSRDTDDTAFVHFRRCYAQTFGPPNDEAFDGHPLAARGLEPYGAFKVMNSSWLRGVEQMNAVHPDHRPELFRRYHHYILSFHDSTFECLAHGYEVSVVEGPLPSLLGEIDRLWKETLAR
jgi:hypothetical protein